MIAVSQSLMIRKSDGTSAVLLFTDINDARVQLNTLRVNNEITLDEFLEYAMYLRLGYPNVMVDGSIIFEITEPVSDEEENQ